MCRGSWLQVQGVHVDGAVAAYQVWQKPRTFPAGGRLRTVTVETGYVLYQCEMVEIWMGRHILQFVLLVYLLEKPHLAES